MRDSQINRVKSALSEGKTVNSVIAFNEWQITRLASYIEQLRRKGWPIISEHPDNQRIANYSLPENWQPITGQAKQADIKKPLNPAVQRLLKTDHN